MKRFLSYLAVIGLVIVCLFEKEIEEDPYL